METWKFRIVTHDDEADRAQGYVRATGVTAALAAVGHQDAVLIKRNDERLWPGQPNQTIMVTAGHV